MSVDCDENVLNSEFIFVSVEKNNLRKTLDYTFVFNL